MTNGSELITGLTNLVIMFTTLVVFFKIYKLNIKNKNSWVLFYISILIDSFLGFIIHSFLWPKFIIDILWIILSFIFCITLNSLLFTIIDKRNNEMFYIIISSILIYLILIIETIFRIDFLLTFIIIASLYLIAILIFYIHNFIKSCDKYYLFYIFGLFLQMIGGLFLIIKPKFCYLICFDKNGIYHLFMVMTIIFFYLGNKCFCKK